LYRHIPEQRLIKLSVDALTAVKFAASETHQQPLVSSTFKGVG
jgi:hypothetical protein